MIFVGLRRFLGLFEPKRFKDPYLWLMQQFGHIAISVLLCALLDPYAVTLFWLVWEIRHLAKSRDWVDFREDLLFEILGVAYFLELQKGFNRVTLLLFSMVLIIYCVIKFKLYKNQT